MKLYNSNKTYFDESIFTYLFASTIDGAKLIIAENEADQWLASKFSNVHVTNKCIQHSERTKLGSGPIVNINPKHLCYGTPIYTLDSNQERKGYTTYFYPITIFNGVTNDKLQIKEYVCNLIYDKNDNLNSTNSAIMIKYYAKHNNDVTITNNLFRFIEHHFIHDKRMIFKQESFGVVQDKNGVLKDENGKLITKYVSNYSGPAVNLIQRFKRNLMR